MKKYSRVLVTGGAGFIGSHVCEALLRHGTAVHVADNMDEFYARERKESNLEEIRRSGAFDFSETDICQPGVMRQIFEHQQPEAVIHLAARAGVRPSIAQPALYERVNVAGTLNLLELAREFKVKKFIFGSSSSVYGVSNRVPFEESQTDLRPISPYAATKLAGELLCYTYAHLYQLPIICLRFFTVYGARQRPDLAIHKFTACLEAGEAIPVFGDGSSSRDYTYVDDIVAGVMSALEHEHGATTGVPYEIFNLGNSHPITLIELLRLLEEATGKKAIRASNPAQAGDVPLTYADISKARNRLGYAPQTRMEDGLKKFIEWYRANPLRAAAKSFR